MLFGSALAGVGGVGVTGATGPLVSPTTTGAVVTGPPALTVATAASLASSCANNVVKSFLGELSIGVIMVFLRSEGAGGVAGATAAVGLAGADGTNGSGAKGAAAVPSLAHWAGCCPPEHRRQNYQPRF